MEWKASRDKKKKKGARNALSRAVDALLVWGVQCDAQGLDGCCCFSVAANQVMNLQFGKGNLVALFSSCTTADVILC